MPFLAKAITVKTMTTATAATTPNLSLLLNGLGKERERGGAVRVQQPTKGKENHCTMGSTQKKMWQ
eukprot:13573756-Ditylum_brightwellii.AAC.1